MDRQIPQEKESQRSVCSYCSNPNERNKFAWEVDKLKWFELKAWADACTTANASGSHIRLPWFSKEERVRPWFEKTMMAYPWDKEGDPLKLLCDGVYPFKDAPDRWGKWRAGKWVQGEL